MAIFEGAGVAIVTPMNENLEVNYDKLEELLEEQIAGGTDAIVICGTTGESATLTEEEHMRTIKFAIDKVNQPNPGCCRHRLQFHRNRNTDVQRGSRSRSRWYSSGNSLL